MLSIRYEAGKIKVRATSGFNFRIDDSGELVVDAPHGVSFTVVPSTQHQAVSGGYVRPRSPDRVVVDGEDATERALISQGRLVELEPDPLKTPGLASYEYLRLVLQASRKPLSLEELTERVANDTGFASASRNLRNTLRTSLGRKQELFRQVGKTHWGLTEWVDSGAEDDSSHG